ncbi:hypothetical protein HYALB_00003097 [Hymenoscyphus albidus]|uniref:2EXR domain-containing protein n=1 Tax=Hymenoscyphus albidus TaxID=595503 RepID=A0A9N9QAX2_9HELO|nr:hypothetical protein HYALB_00003097 [Hymenoscyphus albidus]
MATYDSFPLFATLPSELRLKIWRHALPGPNVLPIRFSKALGRYMTPVPLSPLLSTTSESRAVFLSEYTNLILSPVYPSSIYIDFEQDTLFFDSMECSPRGDLALDLARSPCREKIRKVAIHSQLWEVLRIFRHGGLSEIGVLRGLRTFALVLVLKEEGAHPTPGREMILGDFEEEVMNVNLHADDIREELAREDGGRWASGKAPRVTIWIESESKA